MATRAGVSVSALAHIAIIVIAIVGLGHAAQLQPETVESIAVDLVPESVASVRAGDLNSKIINAPQPAVVQDTKPAQLAQPPGNTVEDQPTPEKSNTPTPKPIVNSAPKPVPQPAPQPVVPPVPAPAPEPKPIPEPAPAPAPEPKPAPTPEPAPQPTEKPQPTPTPDATTPVLAATPTDAAISR